MNTGKRERRQRDAAPSLAAVTKTEGTQFMLAGDVATAAWETAGARSAADGTEKPADAGEKRDA